jgi:hypothetical protein
MAPRATLSLQKDRNNIAFMEVKSDRRHLVENARDPPHCHVRRQGTDRCSQTTPSRMAVESEASHSELLIIYCLIRRIETFRLGILWSDMSLPVPLCIFRHFRHNGPIKSRHALIPESRLPLPRPFAFTRADSIPGPLSYRDTPTFSTLFTPEDGLVKLYKYMPPSRLDQPPQLSGLGMSLPATGRGFDPGYLNFFLFLFSSFFPLSFWLPFLPPFFFGLSSVVFALFSGLAPKK